MPQAEPVRKLPKLTGHRDHSGDGKGPSVTINPGGGWLSGPSWYDKHRERRDKFLAEHPEWNIAFVRSMDRYEASSGETETELIILQDKHLGALMDRLEHRYPESGESKETTG